jgi:tetratricopeptide (TPR) repeat protein
VARGFRVAPAAPSAAGKTSSIGGIRPVALDVRDELLAIPFRRTTASRPDTLQQFRGTLPSAAAPAFDDGAAALAIGDDAKAERGFRAALEAGLAGTDNTAALAYLAATYAASGRDLEAIGIWQAALVDGSGFPQIYQWLGEAFMRVHDADRARAILEEGVGKWPGETRFLKPLAILEAKAGRGREATAFLQRYLGDRSDDVDALSLGVEWLYQLHAAGVVLVSKEADVKAARGWADAYAAANGPRLDEIQKWIQSLEIASTPQIPAAR